MPTGDLKGDGGEGEKKRVAHVDGDTLEGDTRMSSFQKYMARVVIVLHSWLSF